MKSSDRYKTSTELLKRAERVIPMGSQTFSKSRVQFPAGHAPMFLSCGLGGRVWDVDGNEYVDLVCGLLPIVLGYRDPDVDRAVSQQLQKGMTFSLATELEIELAERLVEIIPCAEMVRFAKNGSDVTTAAVRIARAVTGRDRIAAGGYHGWHDWYIGSTVRRKGVPKATCDMTHRFAFGDLESLHKLLKEYPAQFAGVIMEPANVIEPIPGYLDEVCEMTHKAGALLIFDEIITGFRYALGGAQELFGVTPDLATFGKAMGNGMPISAIVGKQRFMSELEEIFFSCTFGGEALSLAAAIAVIDKMRREPVIQSLWDKGRRLREAVERRIAAYELGSVISFSGLPPWTVVQFADHPTADRHAIKTFFIKEMAKNGVLINSSHNICYAHHADDLSLVEGAYDVILRTLAGELKDGVLMEHLGCEVVRPVFSVR